MRKFPRVAAASGPRSRSISRGFRGISTQQQQQQQTSNFSSLLRRDHSEEASPNVFPPLTRNAGPRILANHAFQEEAKPSIARQFSPFCWLQLRSCSNTQTPSGSNPGEIEEDSEKLEALHKLNNLVEAWIEHGEVDIDGDEHAQVQTKLFRSPGLVDDWNLEDWHDPTLSTDAKEEEQGQENGQEVRNKEHRAPKRPGNALPQVDGKKVFGLDKCLPPRVAVEFTEIASLSNLTESDANKLILLSKEDEARVFPEGLPKSFSKEFDTSKVNAMLIRGQLLKLIDHLKRLTGKRSIELTTSSPETPAELVVIESNDDEAATNDDDENADDSDENTNDSNEKAPTNLTKNELIFMESVTDLSYNQRKKLTRERRFLHKADLGSKKQLVLDGLPGSGKTFVLAMLVQWARSEGWLVCYIPSGKKWTHGSLYYKNETTGLWDTPVEAISMLEDLMKSHHDLLEVIPCRVFDPIPLGEGSGVGRASGPQEIAVGEHFTLKDLVQLGIGSSHAATGVSVRLRKELSLVEEVSVLIAVDEFNSWFTFSSYHECYNEFGRRPIHARNLAMVNAYRDMTFGPYMVGAFSHSTMVGKLPKQLPGIPREAKLFLNRYDFLEASIMLKHYIRQLRPKAKFGKRARRALYVLTNGNAHELRDMAFLTAAGLEHGVIEEDMADGGVEAVAA